MPLSPRPFAPQPGSAAATADTAPDWRARAAHWLGNGTLPAGLYALLTGLFWAGDRSNVHTLFYALVAFPAFVLLVLQPRSIEGLRRSPVFLAFAVFAAWCALSIAWSDSEDSVGSLLKRPLYVTLLFIALLQIGRAHAHRLEGVLRLGAATAVLAGALSVAAFLAGDDERLTGYRALSNPILTSHVFGFFLALCLGAWMVAPRTAERGRRLLAPLALAVLAAVLFATAARGALAATAVTVVWLALMARSRRALAACALLAAGGLAIVALAPDVVTQRGTSYRPELWAETLKEVRLRPWLGYGFEANIMLHLAGHDIGYPNPHNIHLAVLRQQGIVGLLLWGALYATALGCAWRRRHDPRVLIASGTVVFGMIAGITEGVAYLSRPKEHWFMLWIPFALLSTALSLSRSPDHRS